MADSKIWLKRKVLVTGGAGFLGSHLINQLAAFGAEITVLDKFTTGTIANLTHLQDYIKLIEADIYQVDWNKILAEQDFSVIFHFAGNANVPFSVEHPEVDFQLNLLSTFGLLETLRKNHWPGVFIFPSSAAVYGNPQKMPIHEEDPTTPISPYGVSKLTVERYLTVYCQLYGMRAASLRPFSVYGPRQRKLVIYDLIRKINQNSKELILYGDGSQVRDFVYVEDLVQATLIIVEQGVLKGETYNVASGKEYSIRELTETLCRLLRVNPKVVYSGAVRPGDPEKWSVNINKLTKLGYFPRISLEDGLERTIEWFRSTQGELIKSY